MQDLAKGIVGQFTVEGRPRTKGSLKGRCLKNRNHTVVMREQIKESKPWRKKIAAAIRQQVNPSAPYDGPVAVYAIFAYERETGADGYIKPTHLEDFPVAPEFGDEDKLSRNLKDAMKDAGLVADDRLVVRCLTEKVWAPLGGKPGMQVHVFTAVPMSARPTPLVSAIMPAWTPPIHPAGTPEYEAYAQELRTELRKWARHEGEYA